MHKTETRLNAENTMQEQTTADRFEAISALADGRLREPALAETLQWLDQDPAARQTWLAYHVIGDVLREPDLAEAAHDSTFVQRLRRRLPYESLSAGSQDAIELIASDEVVTSANSRFDVKTEAANQPRFNWRRVSGVFSLLLLAGLGWALLGQRGNFGSGSAELAAASAVPAPTAVAQAGAGASARMLRDPALDEMLAAHRQQAGAGALQVPAGFLRSATFDGSER